MIITSLENERIKKFVRLRNKKYRDQEGLFLVEGFHLVDEAYKANLIDELILIEKETCPYDIPYIHVTEGVMKRLTMMETPSKVMAVCHKKEMITELGNHLLLLDEIQDPGNLGTIIRSSKAFGIDTIILGDKCCDLYNPKVLRSTQGMVFHINIRRENLSKFILKLKREKIPIYGTRVNGGSSIYTLSKEQKEKYALVMGNEGNGVSNDILDLCDEYLYIPMNKEVESLNVGIATSILLYELNRR